MGFTKIYTPSQPPKHTAPKSMELQKQQSQNKACAAVSLNTHKRRHEDVQDSGERAKRRLIQNFEHLSLNSNKKNKLPIRTGKSNTTFGIINKLASSTEQGAQITPTPINPDLSNTPTQLSAPRPLPTAEGTTDYMDTSGPNTVFIPSIDEFLAAEGTSEEEYKDDSNTDSDDDDSSVSTSDDDDSDLASLLLGGDDDNDGQPALENQRHPYAYAYTGINTATRPLQEQIDEDGVVEADSEDDMDTEDEDDADFSSDSEPARKRGLSTPSNRSFKKQRVDRSPSPSLSASEDSKADKKCRKKRKKKLKFQLKLARKGLFKVPVSVLGPRPHFYEKPSSELLPYIPAEQLLWGRLALWLQQQTQKESAKRDHDETMSDEDVGLYEHGYDSPGFFYSDTLSSPLTYRKGSFGLADEDSMELD